MQGIYPINKSKGPTSNDIVRTVKKITNEKKVGHAGTLDPLAEGVLVVAVGREATRKLRNILQEEKEYVAKIKLGETSTTDDEEGGKKKAVVEKEPSQKEIDKATKKFIGNIWQMPPVYSAVKVSGEEAYKKVRRGEEVKLGARQIEIKEIEILKYDYPELELKVITGSGAYIRSLARDIGEELKTGGYIKSLKRTRVGDYNLKDALPLEQFEREYQDYSKHILEAKSA